jgi:hypothetical protein
MKVIRITRAFVIVICASLLELSAPAVYTGQTGIVVPERFSHAEPFIRTLEGGGLVVQDVAQTTLEASFGGANAAKITTDKGVIEVIVLPGPTDAEQLTITYTKWNGNGHHFYITGPTVRKPIDAYGSQYAYFTLHHNWFIRTFQQPGLDGIVKRILGQTH